MANGPLSILQTAVRSHAQVLISIRSNRKLYVLSLPSISEKRWNEAQQLTCSSYAGSRA